MKLHPIVHSAPTRYLIIGGSVYVFELAVIVLAQRAGLAVTAAVALSFCLGTLVSFFLQKFITFGDTRLHRRILTSQILATAALVVCNLLFTVLVAYALQDHVPAVVSRTLALAATTIWNFYLYKTHIFAKSTPKVIG